LKRFAEEMNLRISKATRSSSVNGGGAPTGSVVGLRRDLIPAVGGIGKLLTLVTSLLLYKRH
jgi:hypothetical protein